MVEYIGRYGPGAVGDVCLRGFWRVLINVKSLARGAQKFNMLHRDLMCTLDGVWP